MSKKSIKIDEDALLKVVTKAINESLDNDNKDEKEEVESNKDQEQWHNEYVNNDDNDVVQARINPKSGKEEYKIPTRDNTVFTTKDAAISALNKKNKNTNNIMGKVVKLNEAKLNKMVGDILNEMMSEWPWGNKQSSRTSYSNGGAFGRESEPGTQPGAYRTGTHPRYAVNDPNDDAARRGFFYKGLEWFKNYGQLPSNDWFSSAHITPQELKDFIKDQTGQTVY